MSFKRIAALIFLLLVWVSSASGFFGSQLKTASGDFFSGSPDCVGFESPGAHSLCRENWCNVYDFASGSTVWTYFDPQGLQKARTYSAAVLAHKRSNRMTLDGAQMALDGAGMIPAVGIFADGLNTVISAGRGNWGDAGLSAVAMIPVIGQGATAGKLTKNALEHGDEAVDAISGAARSADAAAAGTKQADEAAEVATDLSNTKVETNPSGSASGDSPEVFRQGTFSDEATDWKGNYIKGRQWSAENPLTTPDYAKKYGLPGENTGKPDWIAGGKVEGSYKTRPAPPSHNNPANTGGGIEVIPDNPEDVKLDFFYMPDD